MIVLGRDNISPKIVSKKEKSTRRIYPKVIKDQEYKINITKKRENRKE